MWGSKIAANRKDSSQNALHARAEHRSRPHQQTHSRHRVHLPGGIRKGTAVRTGRGGVGVNAPALSADTRRANDQLGERGLLPRGTRALDTNAALAKKRGSRMKKTKQAVHEPGDGTQEFTATCPKCNTIWEAEEFFKCCPTCGGPLTSRTFRKCRPLALDFDWKSPGERRSLPQRPRFC